MADTPFGPGTVLAGRFALDDLLDEHGGARFWRATDQTLARSVAVHVLPDTDARADSLLTAARTSALVSDGHLLRVLDAAAEDGVVYVVNEWGYGVSLDRMLAEGPLSPRRAAWVVKEVAEAIATAHRNGVAHGRLLPENVMITEAGTVKLIGFVMDAVLRSNGGRAQRRVTGGEPMSAHESDVINLAALLYAALVGRWPGSEGSKVPPAPTEHGRALRPRQVRAGIPRPLDAICERVLNADAHPNQTPIETAHEIYAALSDFIGDRTGTAQIGYEATTVLDEDDLAGPHDEAGPATLLHSAGSDTDTGDLPSTGALPVSAPERYPAPDDSDRMDADSTQAGTPVFLDEDSGVGWMSTPRSRGLGGAYDGWAPDPSPNDSPDEPDLRDSRPLFADRRPTLGGATSVGGAGAGSMPPPAWGPDAHQPPAPDDPGREDDRGRRVGAAWIRLAAVIAAVVIVAVAVVFALNLGNGSAPPAADPAESRSESPSPVASTPIPVKGVTDFDPEADPPEENPDLAPLAVDGKPGTAWTTVTYQGNPKLGGLKSGVGLLVDLGKPVDVGGVRLTLLGRPTSLKILAAPRNAQAAPSNIEGLTRVASADNAGRRVRLPFTKPVTTRWLVVWLTSVPPVPGGYKGQVAEISVRS
jgi:serine/threonine protein kinase